MGSASVPEYPLTPRASKPKPGPHGPANHQPDVRPVRNESPDHILLPFGGGLHAVLTAGENPGRFYAHSGSLGKAIKEAGLCGGPDCPWQDFVQETLGLPKGDGPGVVLTVDDCCVDVSVTLALSGAPPQPIHVDWWNDRVEGGGEVKISHSLGGAVMIFCAMQAMDVGVGHTLLIAGEMDPNSAAAPQPLKDSIEELPISEGASLGGWWALDVAQFHSVQRNASPFPRWLVCLTYMKPNTQGLHISDLTASTMELSHWRSLFPSDKSKTPAEIGPPTYFRARRKMLEEEEWG